MNDIIDYFMAALMGALVIFLLAAGWSIVSLVNNEVTISENNNAHNVSVHRIEVGD